MGGWWWWDFIPVLGILIPALSVFSETHLTFTGSEMASQFTRMGAYSWDVSSLTWSSVLLWGNPGGEGERKA